MLLLVLGSFSSDNLEEDGNVETGDEDKRKDEADNGKVNHQPWNRFHHQLAREAVHVRGEDRKS